jgi:NAD(P)-dependent dehydrogenase (short-subunit alcohol dehydrogenase family)
MVSRQPERARRAFEDVRRTGGDSDISLEVADLGSMSSVRDLAARLTNRFDRIDVLINNAGIYRARPHVTEDGFEATMATNHLGHFLLTQLLIDPLRAGAGHIVNVSSDGHRSGNLTRAPLEDIMRGRVRFRGLQAYCDSKLANVLFSFEWARRMKQTGITANALHPGVLSTQIWNQNWNPLSLLMRVFKPFMGRPANGAKAVLHVAEVSDLASVNGQYFDREERSNAGAQAYDDALAAELWELSERLTGLCL